MKRKVLIAPDSFKESLSAIDVSNAIKLGFQEIFPEWEYKIFPVADGGEGTLEALHKILNILLKTVKTIDPLGNKISAQYGITENKQTAIIELAEAVGLELIPEKKRDIMNATSWGLGDLILAALEEEVEE